MSKSIYRKIFLELLFLIIIPMNLISAQNGIVKTYYPDKTLRSEISYVNDVLDGSAVWYYSNGNLKSEKNYSKGILEGWVREFYETGLMKEEYFVKNGIKEGTHRKFYENGALKELMLFSEGILTQKQVFEFDPSYRATLSDYKNGNRQQQVLKRKKQELICDVEICPVPVGGMKSVQENLIYPEHALMYGLEGTVILIATIDINGDVIKTEVLKGLGLGCSEAAQEAVKQTKFLPGQNEGRAVVSNVTLYVEFKMFEKGLSTESKENKNN